jgi:HSP20 family protein
MSTTLTRLRDGVLEPLTWSELFRMPTPAIRVEQFLDHGRYGVRAELPGFNPERDVDVTVAGGVLRIDAERREEKVEKTNSEFHYGRFVRTVPLPIGVDQHTAKATFTNGVLEVLFTMGEPKQHSTHVAIQVVNPTAAVNGKAVPTPAATTKPTTDAKTAS